MQNGSLRGPREESLPNTINQEDSSRTALHDAAALGDEKTLNTLLNGGADRNAKDNRHGNTPLHEAAWRGFSRCVKSLCTLPLQPIKNNYHKDSKQKEPSNSTLHSTLLGTRNAGGFSALHLASQNGHNQSCREILLAGANPDVQNNYGDTPLHTACRYGHAGATRILLSAKCDPNRTNLNGDTPLHISCAMGRRKLTRILLEAGSSLEIKNAQNESPNDIALRKKLTEILDILNSSIKIKTPKENDCLQHKNKTNNNSDKIDGSSPSTSTPNKPAGKKQQKLPRTDLEANPINWSPYGCHYFPDPRTFPSPKLETLPKEPLIKGEQYFLDLAGNIRKGPVGVGNTCYCGPFFRHIEERISKNRKSIRKYVHKATERLDNKVQALALKTDDQIEQLTRSMIADRIRCEGRRVHLEQWLKRGEPHRVTTCGAGMYHTKSKKNLDNVNTLTRCKSLELLGDDACDNFEDRKMINSRSFDILDDSQVTIHRDAESIKETEKNIVQSSSGLSSDNKYSEKGRNIDRESSGLYFDRERCSVSDRLEELLSKTNEIIEMEKLARRRRKEALLAVDALQSTDVIRNKKPKSKDSDKQKSKNSLYTNILSDKLNHTTISNDLSRLNIDNSQFIAKEMEKITSSLSPESEKIHRGKSLTPEKSRAEYQFSQKELDHKCDVEHEKSSIISSSSHKNPSSLGSATYVPDYMANHSNLRVNRTNSRPTSGSISQSISSSDHQTASPLSMALNYSQDYENITEAYEVDAEKKFKDLISALRKDYHSTKEVIATEIYKNYNEVQLENQVIDNNKYEQDDDNEEFDATEDEIDGNVETNLNLTPNGFFKNLCFDENASSSNNTLKSEKQMGNGYSDIEETKDISEMAKTSEINELKTRILNGSNWKSQVFKKSQEILNCNNKISSSDNQNQNLSSVAGVNGIVKKFEIKNSEIKNLKGTTSGILKRSKVQQLVAKLQGVESPSSFIGIDKNDNSNDSETSDDEDDICEENNQNENHHKDTNIEHNYYYNRAQPQVPALNYPLESSKSKLNTSGTQIVDPRNLIPKDAYFHDLPNKNRMRPIVDKIPEKEMIKFLNSAPYNTNSPQARLNPPNLIPRTRNPLPYVNEYNNDHAVNNNLYINEINYSNIIQHPPAQIKTQQYQQQEISPSVHQRTIPYPEKLLANRKFSFTNAVDYELSRINYNNQQQYLQQQMDNNQQQIISITPEQAQFERDASNDSGFSTKISSHGPSPSLSGHIDYGVMNNNIGPRQSESNGVTYFIGNTSSLV